MKRYPYLAQFLVVITLLGSLSLLGCMVGPDYKKPELAAPQSWQASTVSQAGNEQLWWQQFNDPILNHLSSEYLIYILGLLQQLSHFFVAH